MAQLESMVADLQVAVSSADKRGQTTRSELSAMRAQINAAREEAIVAHEERDEYRSSFERLAGVQEELVAVRRSESFRLGRMLLSPITTTRRFVRAWRRAKSPS